MSNKDFKNTILVDWWGVGMKKDEGKFLQRRSCRYKSHQNVMDLSNKNELVVRSIDQEEVGTIMLSRANLMQSNQETINCYSPKPPMIGPLSDSGQILN